MTLLGEFDQHRGCVGLEQPLPVRQWVLAVPKRLRYFLHGDAAVQGVALRILLRVVERCRREHSPGCRR